MMAVQPAVAGRKLASGFFASQPQPRAPQSAALSLGTHQENSVSYWGVMPGCVVATNNGIPTSGPGSGLNGQDANGQGGSPVVMAPFVVNGGSAGESPSVTENALSLVGIGMTGQSASLSLIGRFTGLSAPAAKAAMEGVTKKLGIAGLVLSAVAVVNNPKSVENWIGLVGGVAGVIPTPVTEGISTAIAVGTTAYDITHFQPVAPKP